jgi:hypothetical protein
VFHQPEVRPRRALEVPDAGRRSLRSIHAERCGRPGKRCGPGGCPRLHAGSCASDGAFGAEAPRVIEPSAAPALPSRPSQLRPCRGRVLGFARTRTRLLFAAVSGSHGAAEAGEGQPTATGATFLPPENGPRSARWSGETECRTGARTSVIWGVVPMMGPLRCGDPVGERARADHSPPP